MKMKGLIVLLSLLLCIGLGAPAWAQSGGGASGETPSKSGGDQMGGGMHHKMMMGKHGQGNKMGGCQMAMGGGGCPMSMGGGCPKGGWVGSFHDWMKNFVIHADLFNLSDQQTQQLEGKFVDQMKNVIKTKADIQLMKIDLIQALRKEPIQLKSVRDTMNKIAGKKVDMKMTFLDLYSQIMQMLDKNQQQKVKEVLGSPFPMPWEHMISMGEGGGEQSQKGFGGK